MEYFNQIKQLLIDSFDELIQTVSNYLPNLVSALTLLVIGLVIAWVTKWVLIRLGAGLDRIVHTIGIKSVPVLRDWPFGIIFGWLAFWLIILFFVTAAVDSLGLPGLADWLEKLINNLPLYLVAASCVVGGVILGNYVRHRIQSTARSSGMRQAEMLGSTLKVIIIIFSVITGLDQLGLDVSLFELILVIIIAAVVLSIALAFGLGAGPSLSNVISGRYVRKTYAVGQRININNFEGEILELLPTGVVLDTDTGRTFVPARMFDENASVLLDNASIKDDK
jgi:small-conductance mechanosensitive channel